MYNGTRTPDRHMNRYATTETAAVVKFASKAPNAVPFFDIHLFSMDTGWVHLQNYYTLMTVLDDLHYLTGREWFVEKMTGTEIPAKSEGRHAWSHGAYRTDFKLTDDI